MLGINHISDTIFFHRIKKPSKKEEKSKRANSARSLLKKKSFSSLLFLLCNSLTLGSQSSEMRKNNNNNPSFLFCWIWQYTVSTIVFSLAWWNAFYTEEIFKGLGSFGFWLGFTLENSQYAWEAGAESFKDNMEAESDLAKKGGKCLQFQMADTISVQLSMQLSFALKYSWAKPL